MKKVEKHIMTLRLPKELHDKIKEHLKEKYDNEVSMTRWIIEALKLVLAGVSEENK